MPRTTTHCPTINRAGLMSVPSAGLLLLCYDGSADAKYAIERAPSLLVGRQALVVTVWQPGVGPDSVTWTGVTAGSFNYVEVDRAAAEDGARVAHQGVRIAQEAGLEAEPVAVNATGPVWRTILEIAQRHDTAAIVIGSRGLTGLRSLLLGSVSDALVHHADRPTLVVHRANDARSSLSRAA